MADTHLKIVKVDMDTEELIKDENGHCIQVIIKETNNGSSF
jgi:hypothetical protein